jgi:hypothetical protein
LFVFRLGFTRELACEGSEFSNLPWISHPTYVGRLIYTGTIDMTMEGLDLLRTGSVMGMLVEEEDVTIAWPDLKFI